MFGIDVSKNTRTRMRASPLIVKPLPPFLDFQIGTIPRSHKSRGIRNKIARRRKELKYVLREVFIGQNM